MSGRRAAVLGGRSTRDHEAEERRRTARALLNQPVLSARNDGELLALVRRHGAALQTTFSNVLGYPLVVEAGFARLVKHPLDPATPSRPAQRSSGIDFTPRTYAYLALIGAGLLAPGITEQLLLSQLVEQLKVDAAVVGMDLDDSLVERRSLVAALGVLTHWGVITETAGSVAGWGERHDEALLTVNQAMLPHLLSRPLHTLLSPEQLYEPDPHGREEPRRALRRKLVENPVVRREDLTDAERDALSRERTDISRMLMDAFGLVLEVRAEGALAYDPDDEISDVAFPGNGTVAQAALLLLDALIDLLKPAPGATVNVHGRDVPGLLAGWDLVRDNVEDLAGRHASMWRADLVTDVPRLQAEVVDLLTSTDLARLHDDGLLVHPAAARYRPDPQRAPARPRSRRRLDGEPDQPTPARQAGRSAPSPRTAARDGATGPQDMFSFDTPREQP